ncbi:MAG: ABC transporter ATP-binding protein [Rickettsiaceae bacterium]|nr:ABC transporter ATP-binding protein [Rickettsiaceae bacterium]
MNNQASINIENCIVDGIDTIKRAASLKQIFVKQQSGFSTRIPILQNVSFSCKAGEKIAFIGNNGSGKSSLLKVIAGIYPPLSGKIKVNGKVTAIIEMGLGLEPELTGRQNIKILMLYNNMLDAYNKELEQSIIDFSELQEKIDLPVKTYSSGMLSRLSFSVSLFQQSEILLLDEVFAAGDHNFVAKSLNFLKNKINSVPITILVSHQENIIKENCNRCVLMKNGRIIADGKTDEILAIYETGNY